MYDADALEAINAEQLVTATDRLLLRGGQPSKRRHARSFAEGSQPFIAVARLAEGSQPHIAVARLAEGSQPHIAVAPAADASHPVPPARPDAYLAHPYLARLVAAPFSSVPHAAPPARGSQLAYLAPLASAPVPAARGSQPDLAVACVRSSQADPTAVMRRAGAPRAQVFAVTVVIPALVGVVVGLAALL